MIIIELENLFIKIIGISVIQETLMTGSRQSFENTLQNCFVRFEKKIDNLKFSNFGKSFLCFPQVGNT